MGSKTAEEDAPARVQVANRWLRRIERSLQYEPVVWLLGAATALLGHGAGTSVLETLQGEHDPLLAFWVLSFFGLTTGFYIAYANPAPRRLPPEWDLRVFVRGLIPWIVGAFAAIAFYGAAAGAHRLLSGAEPPPTMLLLGYWVVFGFLVWCLFLLRDDIVIIKTRFMKQVSESAAVQSNREADGDSLVKPTHLVWILSNIPKELADSGCVPELPWPEPRTIHADIQMLTERAPRWPWTMLLCALEPHVASLTELTLVCSRASKDPRNTALPSQRQALAAIKFLRSHPELEKVKRITVWACEKETRHLRPIPENETDKIMNAEGFDFSDVNDLSGGFADLLKYLRFVKRIRSHDILIDFTGGQKPPSAVAVAVTFRGGVRTQYVDTNTYVPTVSDLVTNPEVRPVA